MTTKQWFKIKSSIIDANHHLNEVFPFFNTFYHEFSSGFRLVDNFSNHFSFHSPNCKDKESKEAYLHKLDKIFKNALMDSSPIIVISDASIKNNVATSILHVYSSLNSIKRTIYYAVNITLTEAELFAIRCEINQAVQTAGASYIIVIIDFIHLVKHIFNSINHPYQIQLIAIVQDLKAFFNKNA